ncbi:hypothetical protein HMPREF9374_0859 [Desmospora sp. 8437]|nr:hypothetical protein HMPREF9374_0859 [Desmospora sp. 8437]
MTQIDLYKKSRLAGFRLKPEKEEEKQPEEEKKQKQNHDDRDFNADRQSDKTGKTHDGNLPRLG